MRKQVYLAASYQNRELYRDFINAGRRVFKNEGWDICLPIFDFPHFDASRQIMDKALGLLGACTLLVVEGSEKNVGVGIEVGFAKAKNIPIVYFRKKSAQVSTTIEGTADYSCVYESVSEVEYFLKTVLTTHEFDE